MDTKTIWLEGWVSSEIIAAKYPILLSYGYVGQEYWDWSTWVKIPA